MEASKDQTSVALVHIEDVLRQRERGRGRVPLSSGNGGGTSDGMEPRVAKLESDVEHIKSDVAEIKLDIRELRQSTTSAVKDISVLTERVSHLPTKGFIVGALVVSLALIAALIGFQAEIQAFFGHASVKP